MFGIGIRTQGNGDGGILKHIKSAVEFDGGRTHGVEAARKHLGQGLVKGKRAAILQDKAVEFTKGLTGFKAQDFHGQLTPDVTQRGAEELGGTGCAQLRIEGFIIRLERPQLIELAMQIGKSLDLLGGHGGYHLEAQAKRCEESFALSKSA